MTNESDTEELVNKTTETVVNTLNDVFKSKTFKCSIYLLKYINDKDEEYFNRFIKMFRKFTPQEKMQVMSNVRANLIEQGRLKKQQDSSKMIEETDKTLIREMGIPYDVFEQLDFDEQQKLIQQHRQEKRRQSKCDSESVMIGSGEDAIFVKMKRGQKYMLSDGTIVRAGDTPEKAKARLEDRLDNVVYSKPVALVRRLVRKIKNR